MYQSMAYFKHALAYQDDIEQVIIGIDFFMFNQYLENLDSFDETRLGKKIGVQELINNSLSLDTFKSSIVSFTANFNEQTAPINKESTTSRFKRWLTNFLNFEGFYKTYSLSQEQLHYLQEVIDICKKKNIDVQVFISPTHATDYQAIEVAGLWSTFEQWKQEVTKITPVWDFSGYNSVTSEKISDRMENYIDNSHYSSQAGDLVLNRILGYEVKTVPDDFGVLLTSDNIETHLENIRTAKNIWQKNNSDEVKLVKSIKANLDINNSK
jgi:hypothetical protein